MGDDERRARFEALVRAVVVPLRRYAARRTDAGTAEDVVADALLVLWRRLDDVPAGAELPWCYGVARRCLANAERSARRERRLSERIIRLDPPPVVAPVDDDRLPDPALARALATLTADDRELLRLWAWEDLAPREMAAVLGVSANAVSIRLYRARRRLAAALGEAGKSRGPAGHTRSKGTEATT